MCDLSSKIGHALLFIGNECRSWSLADFSRAAQTAKSLGFDGIAPKRADGMIRWYGNLETERQVVNAQGMHYMPFLYAYGPKFGNAQIEQECALIGEMQHTCGVAVVDMEVEWNGRSDAAVHFVQTMKQHMQGLLIVSTWADPAQQNWNSVINALKPIVDAWWPQQYSDWLGMQTSQFTNLGISCIHPTVDLSQEAGANDPVAIAKNAVRAGVTTISVWEYAMALNQPNTAKTITALLPKEQTMGIPENWKDDSTTLTAPNNIPVKFGFRQYILSHNWDAGNVPQGPEYHTEQVLLHNASVGAGQVQVFRDGMLWYTDKAGVILEPFSGLEIWACYQKIQADATTIQQLQQQIAALQSQVTLANPALPADVIAALKTVATFAEKLS